MASQGFQRRGNIRRTVPESKIFAFAVTHAASVEAQDWKAVGSDSGGEAGLTVPRSGAHFVPARDEQDCAVSLSFV
ncbi:hypothetical protein ACFSLT_16770 [Novosphingobium resinovorum]